MKSDSIRMQIAHALRDRRALAVPHGLEERLHAAVRDKRRPSTLVPIVLAAAVVALAIVVIAVGGASSSEDRRQVRVEQPSPDRVTAGLPPLKSLDDQAVLQALFDGFDPGLDAAQMRRARGIVATFAQQRAIHGVKRDIATADLRRGRSDVDTAHARARLAAAETELMRAEIDLQMGAIDLLSERQQALLYQARPLLASAGKTVPGAQATGELVLATDPAGARAIVDGMVVGITPLHVTLAAGKHRLRLEQAGYQSREQDIEITATEKLALLVAMYARTP